MSSINDDKLRLLAGLPLTFKDVSLVFSPRIKEIAQVGLDNFYKDVSLLLINKPAVEEEEAKAVLDKLSDFEYLLLITQLEPENKRVLNEAFELFTQEKILVLLDQAAIIVGDPLEKRMITKDNFYDFQTYIGFVCAMDDFMDDRIELRDDDDPNVRRIKLQMIEGRKKRDAAKKKNQNNSNKKSDLAFADLIASLPIGAPGYTIESVMNLSYYAFQDQLKRMNWYEEFNINTRAAMAGAKISKDKLTHWIKTMSFK